MEKLEKHIKNQLEQRKITPSNQAWEQISSELVNTPNKSKKTFYWYAVAACLIGLLIVSVQFFRSQNVDEQEVEIVDMDKAQEKVSESNSQTKIAVADDKERALKTLEDKRNANGIEKAITKQPETTEAILVAEISESERQEKIEDSFLEIKPENQIINQKVEEVLATVIDLENMSNTVSDAEIDSLLLIAQQDLLKERVFQQEGKVDAMALLTEVEDELDQSFRNKIFEKLKDGFIKARTAVADRNN